APGGRASVEGGPGAARAGPQPRGRVPLRDLLLPLLPELPGRGPGPEPGRGAEPRHPPRRHRRLPVPGRGRGARGHVGPDRVPQRRGVRPGPHEPGADRRQAGHRRGEARGGGDREEGRVRRAGGRRRPGRRRGGDLCRAQGHPHRRGGRALRRPGARHDGDRELHLGAGDRGPRLAAQLEAHVRQYDVDIMNLQRATALSQDAEGVTTVELESGARVRGRSVVLATGARWRQLGVPGEDQYRNKGVAYCPHCDGPLFKGKRVAVVGGGNSGVEAAIDLAGIVGHVTLIEFDGALRADEVLQRKLRSLANVRVITSAQTTEVLGDGKRVTGLVYRDRVGGDSHRVELEGVFVQIGLLPNTEWLKGTVELSPRGEIVVDAAGRTSLPGVFAAGDATTVPYKQIVIAMGEGAKAALSAFDHLIRSSSPQA